jgi:hypothetical protein
MNTPGRAGRDLDLVYEGEVFTYTNPDAPATPAAPAAAAPVSDTVINTAAQIVEDAFVNRHSDGAIAAYDQVTENLPPDAKILILHKILTNPKIKLEKPALKALGFSDDAAGALVPDSSGEGPEKPGYWDTPSYQNLYSVYIKEGGDPAKFVDWVNEVSTHPYGLSEVINGGNNIAKFGYQKEMNDWDKDGNSGGAWGHNWASVTPQTLDGFTAKLKYVGLPDIPRKG